MVVYNLKKIEPVPSANDFVDIVLTRTQRRTPTEIHANFKINRIRQFYMRKVKFTQQTISERLGQIISDFPRLNDIHPFYADLINILYDRDHYKLALGQLSIAKQLIENVSKDYVRLLKYGDSLYRCKQLKRAALGRMCTLIKKQKASLSYLEEVRKHISRLPALDPTTRTLIVCGYPNVGKSSFMNKITRANVEVQPYAFTTKSLYVGHMDFRYLRWQVIDTPGILDKPLEERNSIEMQAVTALAHIHCCVLYFVDISEQCGYTLQQQISLFESIKPLFVNKPLVIIANKVDVVRLDDLSSEYRTMLQKLADETGTEVIPMSNLTEEGIIQVRDTACEKLLIKRLDSHFAGKKVEDVINRLTVVIPKSRDNKTRDPFIPDSVLQAKESMDEVKARTEKDLMLENGGAGVYVSDDRKRYILENSDWKYDSIPQIMDGKNIADFIDPDIEEKLAALELEEEQLEQEYLAELEKEKNESDIDEEEKSVIDAIRTKKKIMQKDSRLKQNRNSSHLPRTVKSHTVKEIKDHLAPLGIETEFIRKRGRSHSRPRRSDTNNNNDDNEMDTENSKKTKIQRTVSNSRSRSHSRPSMKTPSELGLRDEKHVAKASRLRDLSQRKMNRAARVGESDRFATPKLMKWQNTGKMSLGTRNHR